VPHYSESKSKARRSTGLHGVISYMAVLPAAIRLLVINGPEREADHLLPSSAEIKIVWSHTSSLPRVFRTRCLINYRDRSTAWACRLAPPARGHIVWNSLTDLFLYG
jgi:hypothetical protein